MACSPKMHESNRSNAQKSTGPKTEAGKAKTRGNAIKKGTHCRTVVPRHQTSVYEARMRNWANADAPHEDDRERGALRQAVMASLRSDNGQYLLCSRANKRHDSAIAKHERKLQDEFDAAVKRFKEDPTDTTPLEATSQGCEVIIEHWRAALTGFQEADPDQPFPPEVFAKVASLLGLRAQSNDYGPGWDAFQSKYGGMVTPEDREAMIAFIEGKIATYEEKAEERGEEENEALLERLDRAHADDTPTGRRLNADVDKAVRQMKSWFTRLDQFRNERLREARHRERLAAADPVTLNKRFSNAMQGIMTFMKSGAGPKTENGPVLGTQSPETPTVMSTTATSRPAHGTTQPVTSQPTQVPQTGQIIRPTKVGPTSFPDYDTLRINPDEVRAELMAMGRRNKAEKTRKRHRRR